MTTIRPLEPIQRQASLAGLVTDAQTGRPVGGAVVKIVDGPDEFVDRLVMLASVVSMADDVQGEADVSTLAKALALLDEATGRRELGFRRPHLTISSADGYFHFTELPAGAYSVTASLPGMKRRYADAPPQEINVPVDFGSLPELNILPTTIKGQVVIRSTEPPAGQPARPIAGAKVTVKLSSEFAYSDDEGRYLLAGIEAAADIDRVLVVEAQGYDTGEESVAVAEAGEVVERNIALPKTV